MHFPRHLTLHDALYHLDGGTIVLSAFDRDHQSHGIELLQHASPHSSDCDGKLPGRLYFDGKLVPIRSPDEAVLINLLRNAEFQISNPVDRQPPSSHERLIVVGPSQDLKQLFARCPAEILRTLTADLIAFVESGDYQKFAIRVEQAADQTRYTVWPAWTTETRKAVAVRLGRLLGVSLSAALRYLDDDCRLAEHITALEVANLAERYAAEGLSLRVEPAFPWTVSTSTSQA